MKPKQELKKEKSGSSFLSLGCHQRVTLVGPCYKVPSKRSMSKQEMDISNGFSQLLHSLLNDYVTTQHMGKFIHNMGKFTQSLHILCNDCVNTRHA